MEHLTDIEKRVLLLLRSVRNLREEIQGSYLMNFRTPNGEPIGRWRTERTADLNRRREELRQAIISAETL